MNASEWAAWVQAVGSVAAILVSAALVNWQLKATRDTERTRRVEDRVRPVEDVTLLLQQALALYNQSRHVLKEAKFVTLGFHQELVHAYAVVTGIDTTTFHPLAFRHRLLAAKNAALEGYNAYSTLKMFKEGLRTDIETHDQWQILNRSVDQFEDIVEELIRWTQLVQRNEV